MRFCTVLLFASVSLFSCTNKSDDDTPVDKSFIMEVAKANQTNPDSRTIEDALLNASEVVEQNKGFFEKNAALNSDGSFSLKSIRSHESYIVNLKKEVANLFDPDSATCTLPANVKKKLRRLKDDGKGWSPEYVIQFMSSMPDSAIYLPRTSFSLLLHMVTIKSVNGKMREWPLLGAPTFKNLDIEQFLVKKGFDAFLYSLDCSGYLNAAISGSAVVPGGDIKATAKSALDKKNSMFIAGGVMVSPIAVAYYDDVFGTTMDTATRVAILRQLEKIPDILDTDSIYLTTSYESVWASKNGSASFNGEAQFGARAGVGIGVANLSASGETGGTLSRESSFTAYKTYFTKMKRIPDLKPFVIADVRRVRTALESKK